MLRWSRDRRRASNIAPESGDAVCLDDVEMAHRYPVAVARKVATWVLEHRYAWCIPPWRKGA